MQHSLSLILRIVGSPDDSHQQGENANDEEEEEEEEGVTALASRMHKLVLIICKRETCAASPT